MAGPWVPNLTGSKRKAEATTSAQKKPKATNPAHNWKCALCQVSCTSKDLLNEHKLGKKHRAKLEELQIREESPNSAPKEEDSDTKLQVEGSQKNPKKKRRKQKAKAISEEKKSANGGDGEALKVDGEKQGISSKKKDGQKLGREKFAVWCEKCNVGCTSQSVMNHHIRGKKHLARLEAEMKKEREKREREKRAALAKEAAAVGEAKVKNDVEEEREKRAEERKEGGNEEVGEKPKVEIEVEAKHVVDEKIQG
ncbi:hypothetical protein AMTR_s00019p00051400 [Amborella trichopoda]|uniref:C2H2-type domain-containing protein n=1 Tax=Amborella trichopoda TaxID=13333 RepID=W1PIW9_AMBTC|nr:hypothetical protein AMTR_s00019p00051400 [Amborella trichopoda]